MRTHLLLKVPILDCIVPVPHSIVDLLCTVAKEVLFDQGNVEALTMSIEPLSPDSTYVQQQGNLAILLLLSLVSFQIEEKHSL